MVTFIVQNIFISSQKKKKLESHIKICESKDFCSVAISFEDTKILEFN